jgi:hypothetical protein
MKNALCNKDLTYLAQNIWSRPHLILLRQLAEEDVQRTEGGLALINSQNRN